MDDDALTYFYSKPINRNDLRLLLEWRNKLFNFGTVRIGIDSSLYFSSAIMNDSVNYNILNQGDCINDLFKKASTIKNTGDIHFSIHPDSSKPNWHLRQQKTNIDLISGTIDWFPVKKELVLLRAITPPLEECKEIKKQSHVITQIPDVYTASVELFLIIFPSGQNFPKGKNTEPIILCKHKNYYVSICLGLNNNRLPPAVLLNKEILCN